MNKGVKRSITGYKGLADISTIQGFDLHPRFGHRTWIHLHMWVVRDSNPRPGHDRPLKHAQNFIMLTLS